ncbi:MAG: hypothetical protein ACOCMY_00080 [Campylobacter hyointestinalis]
MRYEYFVSYAHDSGFGNSHAILEQKIDGYELLSEITEKITKNGNFNSPVIILNFILLKEEK